MSRREFLSVEGGARPWVGAKRPPGGRVGRCPAYQPGGTLTNAARWIPVLGTVLRTICESRTA